MLNLEIKIDAFMPYKKSCFYKMKNLEKKENTSFLLKVIVMKM